MAQTFGKIFQMGKAETWLAQYQHMKPVEMSLRLSNDPLKSFENYFTQEKLFIYKFR